MVIGFNDWITISFLVTLGFLISIFIDVKKCLDKVDELNIPSSILKATLCGILGIPFGGISQFYYSTTDGVIFLSFGISGQLVFSLFTLGEIKLGILFFLKTLIFKIFGLK